MDLPHARSLIIVHKTSITAKGHATPTRHVYISSLQCYMTTPDRFAKLIRGHWGGSEIRNHWIRDHLLREDHTRSKNWNINANLSLMRMAMIHIKPRLLSHMSWPEIIETSQFKPSFAYQIISNHRAK